VTLSARIDKRLLSAEGPLALSVELSLSAGEVVTLFGRSGSGKTTILRTLAGLSRPDAGRIECGGRLWLDTARGVDAPPQERRAGMVFQDAALFPTMTVRENLRFALQPGQDARAADELLELVGLSALAARRPASLSGGQRQRVALARALVPEPAVLLLDEPLSALDEEARAELQDELLRLHKRRRFTALLVSHDRAEISKLSTRVLTLSDGRLG
jgi:molybdate transport system ATP-binding protein